MRQIQPTTPFFNNCFPPDCIKHKIMCGDILFSSRVCSCWRVFVTKYYKSISFILLLGSFLLAIIGGFFCWYPDIFKKGAYTYYLIMLGGVKALLMTMIIPSMGVGDWGRVSTKMITYYGNISVQLIFLCMCHIWLLKKLLYLCCPLSIIHKWPLIKAKTKKRSCRFG